MIKTKLAAYGIGFLVGAAGIAFGVGYTTSQFRGLVKDADTQGYNRGVAEENGRWLAQSIIDREAADNAANARESEIEARRRDAETRASEAEKRASAALRKLLENDASFAQCEGQILPPDIRRHFPRGVLLPAETVAADHPDD